jgi:peptidyl-prolyl cis-trans isomerase D
MLQTLREKTSGWIAIAILGMLIVPFAFFGVNNYFSNRVDTWVARITTKPGWFGSSFAAKTTDITPEEFRSSFEKYRQQMRSEQGTKFDSAAFDTPTMRRQVLEQMLEKDLLGIAAEQDGLVLSDKQLQDLIVAMPEFQTAGKFDPLQYQMVLSNNQMSPRQFESSIRQDILTKMLPDEIKASGLASTADMDAFLRLFAQKRDLRWLEIGAPANGGATPNDAEIAAWYNSHASQYRSPEQVALEYLELDAASIAVPTSIDEATLRQRYEDQKKRFTEAEQRLASHILIKLPANASAAAEKAAQAKAAAIAAQARAPGADFAALARANSDDLGSKSLGGDLDWISPGVMLKPFETALYALKPGQISDPVRTTEGWHVIQLRDVRPGKQIPFEQVRAQLEKESLDGERERVFSDRSGKLVDLTLKDPTTLAPAARELGLTVQRTALFSRGGGTGIAANAAVLRSAFAPAQLDEGNTSDPITISPNHIVVIRVADHQLSKPIPLATVRERVIADIQADHRATAAKAAADMLLARANKGEPMETLATASGSQVQAAASVVRSAPMPLHEIIATAFRLPRTQGGKAHAALAKLAPDRYALVEITRVEEGDASTIDAATRESERKQYAMVRGLIESRAYIDALRKRFPVQIAADRL